MSTHVTGRSERRARAHGQSGARRLVPSLLALVLGGVPLGVVSAAPARAQEPELPAIEVDPDPGSGIEVRQESPGSVRLTIAPDRDLLSPTGKLGTPTLGEFSPNNPASYVSQTIGLKVTAGGGTIPRYRLLMRVLSPLSVPAGSLAAGDVGAGVQAVVACNPQVNANFTPDPRTAPKNVDGVPIFVGDLGDCTAGNVEVFRSRCRGGLRTHSFTLVWAVGPQYFTPQSTAHVELLLTVERL